MLRSAASMPAVCDSSMSEFCSISSSERAIESDFALASPSTLPVPAFSWRSLAMSTPPPPMPPVSFAPSATTAASVAAPAARFSGKGSEAIALTTAVKPQALASVPASVVDAADVAASPESLVALSVVVAVTSPSLKNSFFAMFSSAIASSAAR